jgi:hypothetical protein
LYHTPRGEPLGIPLALGVTVRETRCAVSDGKTSTMDRFHELTVSITVVGAGGFSAAARRLGNSQSGISKSISYSAWELPTILAATSNV